ncbi:unnamed protein product [Rhodiola kirilowii]
MDFITHLPPSAGKSTIMVVVDRLSKNAHFSPLKGDCSAAEVAQVFIRDIVKLHGFPGSIVSDRDPIFLSKFWKELFREQGTFLAHSTAYHPQSDGQTKVINRGQEDYLRCFISDNQKAWLQLLPWAEYSYNKAFHSSIGHTPYEVVYGRPPPNLLDYVPGTTTLPAVEELLTNLDQLLQDLKGNLPYRQNSLRSRGTNKLARRFYGPFEVLERIGPVAYRLKLPSTARIHNVFHIALLRRFVGNPATINPHFPAQLEDLRPNLTPADILGSRHIKVPNGWKTQWLIKWKDLSTTEATWEFKDEILKDFPTLNLEAKVASDGGGIDGIRQAHVGAHDNVMHGEGTQDAPAPLRRGSRHREPSRMLPAGTYELQNSLAA